MLADVSLVFKVPEIVPLAELIDNPFGNEPLVIAKVKVSDSVSEAPVVTLTAAPSKNEPNEPAATVNVGAELTVKPSAN